MGRLKSSTLPYILSVAILMCITYTMLVFYFHLNTVLSDYFPASEMVAAAVYLLIMIKSFPILFFTTDLFVPFYNIAMYPPKRSNISKKEWANQMMRRKKQGKLPYSSKFPNGWFPVCRSIDLRRGQVKPVHVLDMNLAVFRGEDGGVYVMDAYCPHLGANMSVLGKVIKNCLQCPFHGWTFRGEDGVCVDIPYCSSQNTSYPKQARVKSHNAMERNGNVFMWYHRDNQEPDWFIEPIDNYEDFYEAGQISHTINCHISEIPENGADFAHFFMLHEENMLAGGDMEMTKSKLGKLMTHKWTPKNWKLGWGEEKHMIKFDLHLETFFGQSSVRVPGFSEMKAEVHQMGPAYVSLKINLGCLFQGYFIQTITPEEQFMQRVSHRLIAKPHNQLVLTKLYLQSERSQFERDISMWNHKVYKSNPVLVKDDGPIRKYRNWYQQFYSTVKDAYEEQKETETGNSQERKQSDNAWSDFKDLDW